MALIQPSRPAALRLLPSVFWAVQRPRATLSSAWETSLIHPLRRTWTVSIPLSISTSLPSILQEVWDNVLRAVPKKKTSHAKKRTRQMVGKALKDVTALNKCPACGNVKRAHVLCRYCVKDIKDMWKQQASGSKEDEARQST